MVFQNEQTAKGHELLQLRSDCREMRETLESKDSEIAQLKEANLEKDDELDKLREEIKALNQQVNELRSCSERSDDYVETEILKAEIRELREELSDMSLNEYGGIEPGRGQRNNRASDVSEEDMEIQRLSAKCSHGNSHHCQEVDELRKDFEAKNRDFEKERMIWAQEKEKVLRYQRQLQMNYVQMYRRTRALEAEVESLTMELELDKTGLKKKLPSADLTQTIEL